MATSQQLPAQPKQPTGTLAAKPGAIRLTGAAGSKISTKISVKSSSKVTLELDTPGVARFRKPDALAQSIREGFVKTEGDFVTRLVALGKQLEHQDTLEVKYSYRADFKALEPGEAGTVDVDLKIPRSAAPSDDWTARLPLLGTTLPATLKVSASKPARKRKTRGNS